MPDTSGAMTLLGVVLGFAHDAVSNDAAWAEVFNKIRADRPDDPDFQGDDASEKLRAMVHSAVDATTEALVSAEQQMTQLMKGRRTPQGLPQMPAQRPADPAHDAELDAMIARQYL